jgi:hypothetical protein
VAGRPLAGVIPDHDLRGPIALYNAKVWKIQKGEFCNFAKSQKSKFVKSAKSDAKVSSVRNFRVRVNGDK